MANVIAGEPDNWRNSYIAVELAVRRLNTNQPFLTSYINQCPTENHGTHVDGLWLGAWHSVRADTVRNAEHQIGLDEFRDIFAAGLQAILHVSLEQPSYVDTWKERLHSEQALVAVRTVVSAHLAPWLQRQTEPLLALDAGG